MILKKVSLILSFLFVLFSISQAQVSLGIQFGESHFTEKVKTENINIQDREYKSGFYLGLYTKFKVKNHWYIQPEISFLEKGHKKSGVIQNGSAGQPADYQFKVVYNYIELPILVKWEILFKTKHRLEIGAGPSIGLLVGKERMILKTEGERTVVKGDYQFQAAGSSGAIGIKELNKIDAGMCVDLSYAYQLRTGSIKLGARNCIDFTNAISYTEEELENAGFHIKFTNLGFAFYVGYEIALGKKKNAFAGIFEKKQTGFL